MLKIRQTIDKCFFRQLSSVGWDFKDTASVDEIISLLSKGDRSALSKTITLVESTREDHREKSKILLDQLMKRTAQDKEPSFRIGLTGPPGAGKSTFIEKFGMMLLNDQLGPRLFPNQENNLAVLAIDPSSKKTRGSLLGDKTRMLELSYNKKAFIRPSSTGDQLGGVARATNENILLCEAANFNTILVETVGVGQSEYSVSDMVDMFVLIIPPAGGDELQGIKKGIIEYVDIVIVNKCDGDLKPAARRVAAEYNSALKFSQSQHKGWKPKVRMVSSQLGEGIQEFWETAIEFRKLRMETNDFFHHRTNQILSWMKEYIEDGLRHSFETNLGVKGILDDVRGKVRRGELTPGSAADILMEKYLDEK